MGMHNYKINYVLSSKYSSEAMLLHYVAFLLEEKKQQIQACNLPKLALNMPETAKIYLIN